MKLFIVLSSLALLATTYATPTVDGLAAIFKGDTVQGFAGFSTGKKCGQSGTIVRYSFSISTATDQASEYSYHIHELPVDANGNCTSTGGHFDPHKANPQDNTYKCIPEEPSTTCEVGDLSGKHGKLKSTSDKPLVVGEYMDADVHLSGDDTVAGRSVVVHNAAGDRIACANIIEVTPRTISELRI
ncbi:Cell surface superoxide dismutase [Cu-Zn] 4 [Dispira simplex]|nr:Cell surface superoxide dismutase [Cu-Zn] 4 [Dispira simplex]